jgi:hypothetical protein
MCCKIVAKYSLVIWYFTLKLANLIIWNQILQNMLENWSKYLKVLSRHSLDGNKSCFDLLLRLLKLIIRCYMRRLVRARHSKISYHLRTIPNTWAFSEKNSLYSADFFNHLKLNFKKRLCFASHSQNLINLCLEIDDSSNEIKLKKFLAGKCANGKSLITK